MKECAGKLFRRIGARLKKGAVLGTGAVLIASQVLSIVPAPTAAYAASSETITRGERVNYGGYYMYNSTTSEGTPAICLDPAKRHPLDASTARAQLPIESDWSKCYTGGGGEQTKIDRLDGMARVLYYGPTGPGFEEAKAKGLWNFNWYDGTPLDYSKMLAIQHIALSALSKSSSQYGMQGTTAAFRNWCYKTVLYYNGNLNAGTFLANLDKYLPGPAPQSFKDTIYLVNYGTGTQCLITFHNKGKLKLKKASSNPGISDNNPCYSLEGATYGVYSDPGCTQQVGTLSCNASGDSNVIDITPGTYYVKETKAGKSYALDGGDPQGERVGRPDCHRECHRCSPERPRRHAGGQGRCRDGQGLPARRRHARGRGVHRQVLRRLLHPGEPAREGHEDLGFEDRCQGSYLSVGRTE